MQNEKIMRTLDDFEAFLDEVEHPAASFPTFFLMSGQEPESMLTLLNSLIDSVKAPLFYIARGFAYQCLEDFHDAIADYDRFLADGALDLPAFPFAMAHFQKGVCYLSLEENAKAKRDFQTAIDLNPHVSDHYRGLATALFGLGKPDTAWETMGDAIRTATDKAEANEIRTQRFSALVEHLRFSALAEHLPNLVGRMLNDTTFAHEMRADLQAVAQALDAGTAPPEIAASPEIRDMIEQFQILQNDTN